MQRYVCRRIFRRQYAYRRMFQRQYEYHRIWRTECIMLLYRIVETQSPIPIFSLYAHNEDIECRRCIGTQYLLVSRTKEQMHIPVVLCMKQNPF